MFIGFYVPVTGSQLQHAWLQLLNGDADVENAYAGLEKKGKGKKGKGAARVADGPIQSEDKKLMHSLDMLGAFATLKVHSHAQQTQVQHQLETLQQAVMQHASIVSCCNRNVSTQSTGQKDCVVSLETHCSHPHACRHASMMFVLTQIGTWPY